MSLGVNASSIRHVFEAAFRSRPTEKTTDPQRFVLLPQQSESELVLAEVHSKLDHVVSFLQREIGYTLLSDARPVSGGGVLLRAHRSVQPLRSKGTPGKSPRKPPEVNEEETKEVIRMSLSVAKNAHFPDDLVLVSRFVTMLGESTPSVRERLHQEEVIKTILRGVRLMHLCDFSYSDVVMTLSYASVYFRVIFHEVKGNMGSVEAAHICVLSMYLAHCFILDENCPLCHWQKHIFRKYCTLKVLDSALFSLFHKQAFHLRIASEEERKAVSFLLAAIDSPRVVLTVNDSKGSEQLVNGHANGRNGVSPSSAEKRGK
eukprot:TRINITY_DN29069_c0_g1_i1.p1 TRINITY_DN29069_c0_g1~~TRINITY_DN29069_c0_g1_i1.p1  ORF type:complete len:317 (+),score=48.81 TRINITY_DN29069_c0_g1_i1:297-1247(+)